MLQHKNVTSSKNIFLTSHGITLNSGLQYTDTAYVATILCILVPVSVGSFESMNASELPLCLCLTVFETIVSAKHLRYLVSAIYGSVCCFFYVISWQCNLDVSAGFGVTSSLIILALAAIVSAFYTKEFAWPIMIQWLLLVVYGTLFQFIACLTTLKIGVLIFLPGYLTAPVHYQFALQMIFFSAFTIITYLFLLFVVGFKKKFGQHYSNWVISYIAAYFIVAGVSYLSLLTGLLPNSEFDPIGLFGTPSPISFTSISDTFLSFLWIFLGYIGWTVQKRRDDFLKERRMKKKIGVTDNADYSDAVSYLLKNESEKDLTLSA